MRICGVAPTRARHVSVLLASSEDAEAKFETVGPVAKFSGEVVRKIYA